MFLSADVIELVITMNSSHQRHRRYHLSAHHHQPHQRHPHHSISELSLKRSTENRSGRTTLEFQFLAYRLGGPSKTHQTNMFQCSILELKRGRSFKNCTTHATLRFRFWGSGVGVLQKNKQIIKRNIALRFAFWGFGLDLFQKNKQIVK